MVVWGMKTTVDISDSLFNEARSVARDRGLTMRQLIEDGLRQSIRQQSSRSAPFRLKDGSFKGKGLREDLSWGQVRQVIYEGRGE